MRRGWFCTMVAAVALSTTGCTWSFVGFDPGRTGSGADATITPQNVKQLQLAWKTAPLGDPVNDLVVDDNAVFATAGSKLVAYEQGTGVPRWSVDLPQPPIDLFSNVFGSLGSAGGVVYAGNIEGGPSGSTTGGLRGYGSRTGAVVWTGVFPDSSPLRGPRPSVRAPLVTGGVVVSDWIFSCCMNEQILGVAVYEQNGALRWASTDGRLTGHPAVAGNTVYASVDTLDAYDLAGTTNCAAQPQLPMKVCTPLWQSSVGGLNTPSVAGSTVFATGLDGNLYAFAAGGCGQSTCAPLWSAPTGAGIVGGPAVANGLVYVANSAGRVFAFTAEGCGQSSCPPVWQSARSFGSFSASPSIAGGVLFIGSSNKVLYAFAAAGCGAPTCAPRWHYKTNAGVDAPVAVAYGRVFLGGHDGSVSSFGLPPGS
ncbi:MAG: sorting protein [Actinomycetia bacterium]|nr:sorting protein [Actinomycetes bacterium]